MPIFMIGQAEPIGFHAARFVNASSVAEAEQNAFGILRTDPGFNVVPLAARPETATIYFEETVEVAGEIAISTGEGFTFFTMGM